MIIDYPKQITTQLSDGEQFVNVFCQLVQDKVKSVGRTKLGVHTIYFKDGTQCGATWLWKQAGLDI